MDKIKAFFSKKWVKIVAWVLLAVSVVVLIVGGATTESVTSGVVLASAIVSAVAGLIAFISGQVSKSEQKKIEASDKIE